MILFLSRMASSLSPGRALTRLRAPGFRLKATDSSDATSAAPKKYSGPAIKFSPTGGATKMGEPQKEGAFNSLGNRTGGSRHRGALVAATLACGAVAFYRVAPNTILMDFMPVHAELHA